MPSIPACVAKDVSECWVYHPVRSFDSALRVQVSNTSIGGEGLIVTGNATDDAHDSVKIALTWVRYYRSALLAGLGLNGREGPSLADVYGPGRQLHIHVAPGATPKNGICGGAIAIALVSFMTKRPVMDNLVVVGEMGSQGQLYGLSGFELSSVRSTVELCGYQHMVVSEAIWESKRDWLNERGLQGLSIVGSDTLHRSIGSILGRPLGNGEGVDEGAAV